MHLAAKIKVAICCHSVAWGKLSFWWGQLLSNDSGSQRFGLILLMTSDDQCLMCQYVLCYVCHPSMPSLFHDRVRLRLIQCAPWHGRIQRGSLKGNRCFQCFPCHQLIDLIDLQPHFTPVISCWEHWLIDCSLEDSSLRQKTLMYVDIIMLSHIIPYLYPMFFNGLCPIVQMSATYTPDR